MQTTTTARFIQLIVLVVLAMSMSACEAVGSIFEAGVWAGAVIVIVAAAVIWLIASKLRRRA